jgi:uncharacterized membrane protein YkoI
MKTYIPRVTVAAVVLALAFLSGSALSEDKDHKEVRDALAKGEILPLTRILEIAQQKAPGDVIKVKLSDEHGRLVYEVKVLAASGRVLEVELDARTGAVLEIEED